MPTLYIDIDSLRPDHLGCYGYGPETSPNIDRLSEDGVQFDRMYAANSPCMPSRAAAISGRYGINNGVVTHDDLAQVLYSPATRRATPWGGIDDSGEWWTLPELFFRERIPAIGIASFPRHPAPWFYHLWKEYYHPREPEGAGETMQTPRAERVADMGVEIIEERADEEFFLYVQFWDPHDPYNRTDDQVERFRGGPLPPYPTEEQIADHQDWDTFRSPNDPGLQRSLQHGDYPDGITNRTALGELLAHYDAEIRYTDAHVGRLLDALRENGLYDETLVVVTGDHGEEFGEHGLYREHWSTYDGTQRVPLLVKPPGTTEFTPGSRDDLVTNVDLALTIADYADLAAPSRWQGRSLRPVVEEPSADWREFVVLDHGVYTAQRAVRTDEWKYVRTYHPGMWEGILPEELLFDVEADPWEQDDVASDHPGVVEELRRTMTEWADAHAGPEEDPLRAAARNGPVGIYRRFDVRTENFGPWSGV